jgi:hypothetical protein
MASVNLLEHRVTGYKFADGGSKVFQENLADLEPNARENAADAEPAPLPGERALDA